MSGMTKEGGPHAASACASSNHAIGLAFRAIKCGDADVMLACGSEATITPLGIAGFCALRALSTRNEDPTRASRPFDKQRDGFVIGEGAAALVLTGPGKIALDNGRPWQRRPAPWGVLCLVIGVAAGLLVFFDRTYILNGWVNHITESL